MDIKIELPGVKLAVVEADGVTVAASNLDLAKEMDDICNRLRGAHTVESAMELDSIRAVRAMFRLWGIDPTRYRPSSEALTRRVVQGKGLYRISNVVDIGNCGSIETGWPYGSYNRALLTAPVSFREGAQSETYEGIGKQTWHLAGRPVLADASGAFGSPISDSTRTMVTEAAQDVLSVIYAPAAASDSSVKLAAERLAQRLESFAGAKAVRIEIITKL